MIVYFATKTRIDPPATFHTLMTLKDPRASISHAPDAAIDARRHCDLAPPIKAFKLLLERVP